MSAIKEKEGTESDSSIEDASEPVSSKSDAKFEEEENWLDFWTS
jgi:hypothetical protein